MRKLYNRKRWAKYLQQNLQKTSYLKLLHYRQSNYSFPRKTNSWRKKIHGTNSLNSLTSHWKLINGLSILDLLAETAERWLGHGLVASVIHKRFVNTRKRQNTHSPTFSIYSSLELYAKHNKTNPNKKDTKLFKNMSASSLEFVPTLEMCLGNDARHNSMKSKFTTSVVLQLDSISSHNL